MKSLIRHLLTCSTLAAAVSASAVTVSFQPSDADLGDLDHHSAYTWGIDWNAIPAGQVITSATLTITDIYDWQAETDRLFIQLLNNPKTGVRTIEDNTNDNVISDYFETTYTGVHSALTSWSDPVGGVDNGFDFTYQFTQAQLNTLMSYITDAQVNNRSEFGLGFDPDCHYYNRGVCLTITTGAPVPDAGSSLALLGLALSSLAGVRRFTRA